MDDFALVLKDDEDDEPQTDHTRALYKAALGWSKRGYNVVPRNLFGGKYPAVKWKELQARLVTEGELLDWYGKFAGGFGFITGAISGAIVIETDGPEGEALLREFERQYGALPATLMVRSGSGRGLHRHFKHPGHHVKTKANPSIKVDIKGDGGFCVLPPSKHKSGGDYEIVHDDEPAVLPGDLLAFIEAEANKADEALSPAKSSGNGPKRSIGGLGRGVAPLPDYLRNMAVTPNILPLQGPPPPVEEMRARMEYLRDRNYFKERSDVVRDVVTGLITGVGWVTAGMALKPAYGDEVGFELWEITHIDERARNDAPDQWRSFASEGRPGDVTIGTLIKASNDAGFCRETISLMSQAVQDEEALISSGDVKNGQLFAKMFRDRLLYIHETGEWLLFAPQQGWLAAPPGEADRAAKEVLARLGEQVAQAFKTSKPEDSGVKGMIRHVMRTSDAHHLRAMIEMAKSEPGMTVQISEFDSDPMLLGVANGVLDLRTGALLPVSPDVLVSKRCAVAFDPSATCPRFEQFMLEVQPDPAIRDYLHRLMGYCLTGLVTEQVFQFFHGGGNNGKGVLIENMAWLLGDYARKIPTEMLMQHQRNPQGPSPDIVSLKGMRFVFANETEEGRRLAEARVKDMTGGDTLTGRVPYGKADITFRPTHKLFIVGNHKPEITDTSFGMWRRVVLTIFDQTFTEANRDVDLGEKLMREGSGVLNWMLDGLHEFRKRGGLQVPAQIAGATAAYRDEQDIIGEWIGDKCNTGAGFCEQKAALYIDYKIWCELNGHMPLAQGRLTRRLNDRGYRLAPDKRTVHGLSTKSGIAAAFRGAA